MIDKDKIFQLFVDGKEINDEKTKSEIKDFMNGPFAKIGMFVKLIQNHQVFHQKLEKFLMVASLLVLQVQLLMLLLCLTD